MEGMVDTNKLWNQSKRESDVDRRKRFALEYLVDFSRKGAAIRAGYSQRSAASIGSWLFKRPDVQQWIKEEQEARAKRVYVKADRVLQELARMAFFDPRKLFREDGTAIPIGELDDDTAACISAVDVDERRDGRVWKYRIGDKGQALTNCMRHLGMLSETLVHTGPAGGPVALSVEAAASLTKALKARLRARKS